MDIPQDVGVHVHGDMILFSGAVKEDGVHMDHPAVGQAAQELDGAQSVSAAPEGDQGMQLIARVFTARERPEHEIRRDPGRRGAQGVIVRRVAALGELPELPADRDVLSGREHGFLCVLGDGDLSEHEERVAVALVGIGMVREHRFAKAQVEERMEAGVKTHIQFIRSGIGTAEVAHGRVIEGHHILPDALFQLGADCFQLMAGAVALPEAERSKIDAAVGGRIVLGGCVADPVGLEHALCIVQRVSAVFGMAQTLSEIVDHEDMHALNVGIHRGEIRPAADDRTLDGQKAAVLDASDQARGEHIRKVLQQHGKAHGQELPAARLIGRVDHGMHVQSRFPEKFIDLLTVRGEV